MIYETYTGRDSFVTLENLPDDPITHIAPKAFLSCKSIRSLILPDTVEHIGDWAFAHMQEMTDVTLPARSLTFGKKVFLDCGNLKRIHLTSDNSGNEGLALFLGAVITILQDISLLRPELAGGSQTHSRWLADFDKAVADFLLHPDELGYEPVFYGWFNDEDADSTQLPKYLHKRRSQKLELAFLRLRYDLYLEESLKGLLQDYLTEHLPTDIIGHLTTVRSNSNPPLHTITWELLPAYCREEVTYIKILADTGALTAKNIPLFLAHLQDACPEVIAFLLRQQSSLQEKSDFFGNFAL